MLKTVTLNVSDEVAAFVDTPEMQQRIYAFIHATYTHDAARIESLLKGSAQVDAGEGLPLEESRSQAHTEFLEILANDDVFGRLQ